MPRDTAPQVPLDVAKADLTGRAGLAFVAPLIRFLDLGALLRRKVRVWREQLEADMAPLLAAAKRVWLRADGAH